MANIPIGTRGPNVSKKPSAPKAGVPVGSLKTADKKTWVKPRFDIGLYADESDSLKTLFKRLYRGEIQEAPRGDLGYRSALMDIPTTREYLIGSTGYDFFDKNNRPDLKRIVKHPVTGHSVPLGSISIKDARSTWDTKRKQSRGKGYFLLGNQWVKATPDTLEAARRGRVTATDIELARFAGALGLDISDANRIGQKMGPLYRDKLQDWVRQYGGDVSNIDGAPLGIPLPRLKKWIEESARRKIEKEKWHAEGGKARIRAFEKPEKGQDKIDFPYLIYNWNPRTWKEVEAWMRTPGSRVEDRLVHGEHVGMPHLHSLQTQNSRYWGKVGEKVGSDGQLQDIWRSTLETEWSLSQGLKPTDYKSRLEAIAAHQAFYSRATGGGVEIYGGPVGPIRDYTEDEINLVKKDFLRRKRRALRVFDPSVESLVERSLLKKKGLVKEYGLFVNKEFPDQHVWAPREEFLKQDLDTFVEVTNPRELAAARLGKPVNVIKDPAEQLPQGPAMRPSPIPGTLTPIAPVEEMTYTQSAARRGTRQQLIRDAGVWAEQTGLAEHAKNLDRTYGRESAQNRMMTLHAENTRSKIEHENFDKMSPENQARMKTPFGGNFRKAHALGHYGFANWHKVEGFNTPSEFVVYIKRVLERRKKRFQKALKKGGLSERRESYLRDRIEGYDNALRLHSHATQDKEGVVVPANFGRTYSDPFESTRLAFLRKNDPDTPEPRKFRLPPFVKNSYGMLVQNDPEAYLYAAYYDMFRKNPDGKIVPRDFEFQGLSGDPEYAELQVTSQDENTGQPIEIVATTTQFEATPVDSWKTAVEQGVKAADLQRRWLKYHKLRSEDRARRGVGDTAMEDLQKGALQVGEFIVFAPGNAWKAGEGFIEGVLDSALTWGGSALAGVEKKDLKSLRKASPTEIQSLARHWRKVKQNPNWNSWELNKIFVDHTKRDVQMARDMEAHQLENVKKDFLDAVGNNLSEIVTGMAQLPSIILGEVGGIEGRNTLERFMNSLEMAQDRGFEMGAGMVNFLYILETRGIKETFLAAPLDTLEVLMPTLRLAVKTGRVAGKVVPPKAMEIIKRLNRAGKLASKMVQDATGVKVADLYEAAERQTISTALKLQKKFNRLSEGLMEAGAAYKGFVQSYLAQREVGASALMSRLDQGMTQGSELRNMASSLKDTVRSLDDPSLINETLSFVYEFLGEERIRNTPELLNAFDEAYRHLENISDLTPEQYTKKGVLDTKKIESRKTKKRRQEVLNDATDAGKVTAGRLAKALEDLVEERVKKEAGSEFVADVLAPVTTIYHGRGVESPARPFGIHSDWAARDFLITTLRGKKRPASRVDHANPQATIQELKRLRSAFERGKVKGDAVEWLFGEKVNIDAMDNAELGEKRLFHGTSGKLEDRKAMGSKEIKRLASRLDDAKTRKKVRDAIDQEIKRLEGLEPLSAEARSALGLKGRRTVDGGVVDDQFPSLGTAKSDGTRKAEFETTFVYSGRKADQGPDVYVPRGTSEAIVGRKLLAEPVTPGKEVGAMSPSQRKRTNAALRQQIAELKKDPAADAFFSKRGNLKNATTQQLQTMIDIWANETASLKNVDASSPEALNRAASLVEKLYGIKKAAYKNIAESRRAVLMGEKVNPVLDTFKKTLEDHGAVAAFNELFGHKDGGVTVATTDIENLPGALDMLKGLDTSQLQQVLHEFRGGMVESVVGPKKATIEIGDNISSALEKYADQIEGAAVREWWEGEGGTEVRLTERALRDKNKRPSFINEIVSGEKTFDLPPVFEVAPDRLIQRLENNKESLRREAREKAEYVGMDPDTAEYNFELSYDNAIQRLRRYEILDSQNSGMFGVNPSDRIYVPRSVNSAINTMNVTRLKQGPVLSWIKRNLTSRNAKAFMNNLLSSVMLQFGRTGSTVNPFKYRKLLESWHNRTSANKKVRERAEKEFQELVTELKLSPEDIRMMQDIRDVPRFLDGGNFEIELGGSAGFHRLNPLKSLERAYQFTDQGFKFDEAIRSYKWLQSKWDNLDAGETFRIETNDGVYMTLEKGQDGTAFLLSSSGKAKKALSSDAISKAFASAGAHTADRLFGNYRQMSKALAWSRHPSVQIIGGFAPLLTWAYKATPFPGKKSIPQEVFNPYPFLQTNSKKAQASMGLDYVKAAGRQYAAFQAGRERMLEAPAELLAQMFSYTPGQVREFLVRELSDHGFLGTKDLGWMSPWGPVQSLFRAARWGYWELIEKGNLGGDNNKYFVDHWMGPKGTKDKKRRLMINLTGEEAQKNGYSNPDGSLTDKGKKTLELRRYIVRQMAKGETYGAFDAAQTLALSGPALRDIVNALQSAGRNRSRSDKISRDLANGVMLMALGGTVTNAFDVTVGLLDRNNIFTSRRNVPITDGGESAMRFAIRRLTGLGFKPRQVSKNKTRMLRIIKDNLMTAFLGSNLDQTEDTINGGINKLENEIKVLNKQNFSSTKEQKKLDELLEKKNQIKRIVNSEIFNLDLQYTDALNFYAAAQQSKRRGRKERAGVGKKMSFYRVERRLVKKDGRIVGAKYVRVPIRQEQTGVQQLYKIETPGKVWKKGTELTQDLGDDFKPLRAYHYEDVEK